MICSKISRFVATILINIVILCWQHNQVLSQESSQIQIVGSIIISGTVVASDGDNLPEHYYGA